MSNRALKRQRRETRARLRELLLGYATRFRQLYAERLKAQRERFPNMRKPCDTCALRTSTDHWQGFDRTWLHFIGALATGATFYCHEKLPRTAEGWTPVLLDDGVPDPDAMPPCAAWFIFKTNPPFSLEEAGIDDATAEKLAEILMTDCAVPPWA